MAALSSLKELEAAVEKGIGAKLIQHLVVGDHAKVLSGLSSGSLCLNHALSGTGNVGYAWGRIVEIYGPEMCLDADTFIQYTVKNAAGVYRNHKGGTIRRLYERFHNIDRDGTGYYKRSVSDDSEFYVPSINCNNAIFTNKVADVVSTGVKECFTIRTVSGKELTCTGDHKFYTGKEYVCLRDLRKGDTVYIHDNTPYRCAKVRKCYSELYVKYHSKGRKKQVTLSDCTGLKKYTYERYRLRKSHAVIEAYKNNMSFEQYLDVLNTCDRSYIDTLWTVPEGYSVHHKDMDVTNDTLENLDLVVISEHHKYHSRLNIDKLSFVAVADTVDSITSVGSRDTYDVKCFAPHNNYVANGFVVHNSGKSTLALHAVAEAQKLGLPCMYVDAEHACDPTYMASIGINLNLLSFLQPDFGEQSLDAVIAGIKAGYRLIVVDSVAALTPLAELEGEMGDAHVGRQARMMGQGIRKLVALANKNKTIVVFINQIRMKIGVMFGNPETTPGGNALKFFASYRLEVRSPRGGKIEGKDMVAATEEIGIEANVKVVKNKLYPPFRKASFDIIYGKGIDKFADAVEYLERVGKVVDKKIKINGKVYTKKTLTAAMRVDPKVKHAVIALIKGGSDDRDKRLALGKSAGHGGDSGDTV